MFKVGQKVLATQNEGLIDKGSEGVVKGINGDNLMVEWYSESGRFHYIYFISENKVVLKGGEFMKNEQ
jgi:hypothetical protein